MHEALTMVLDSAMERLQSVSVVARASARRRDRLVSVEGNPHRCRNDR
jgi:hypothetical protein